MSSNVLNLGATGNGKNYRSMIYIIAYNEDPNNVIKMENYYVVDPKFQYHPDIIDKEFKSFAEKNFKYINPNVDITVPLRTYHRSIIIIDEAQRYFGHDEKKERIDQLVDALTQCRHNKNVTILNFHALNLVPKYIINHWNQMMLGHTNDKFEESKRFGVVSDDILKAMQRLQKNRAKSPHAAISIINL